MLSSKKNVSFKPLQSIKATVRTTSQRSLPVPNQEKNLKKSKPPIVNAQCQTFKSKAVKSQVKEITANKTQYTDHPRKIVTSCCANAMTFLEMLYKKEPDKRLNITIEELDQAIDTGYVTHQKALDASNEYACGQKVSNTHFFGPFDLSLFFDKFESNTGIHSHSNTELSDDLNERVAHFERVYSNLEQHLSYFGGVVGSTMTCNKQTYCLFVIKDEKGKHYGVFDSHGKSTSRKAFAFHSTNKKEAAKRCELLAGFVPQEKISTELKEGIRKQLQAEFEKEGKSANSKEFEDAVAEVIKQMSKLEEGQNEVSYHYLFPKSS